MLFNKLKQSAAAWREEGYACKSYPLISEILAWQSEIRQDHQALKFLREPQFLALEVYWYVRLVLNTPHIVDLYKHYYGEDKEEFFRALGVSISEDALAFADIDAVIQKIREDQEFVQGKKVEALHEAVTLDYPSYILALAMGAGKTVLIGAVIATEFAMSLRYSDPASDGDSASNSAVRFMKNALVFAPGTTIMESLRELVGMDYGKILPPDLLREFIANLKIEFPGKEKDIQAQERSAYNLIVTNTEKISLRARQRSDQSELEFEKKQLQANRRLQRIAGLPNLGIFSDEAHHTYGNTFDKLKRVRQTIGYIHQKTPVVAVVNTTGTPYYKRQLLAEVITWYGLGDGIRDNILKSLTGGIHEYDIGARPEQEVFGDVIREFFSAYGDVALPNGAKAKIAFYFKNQAHLEESKVLIEKAMVEAGQDVSQVLVNTQRSKKSERDEFVRLNNPGNQKRVILLIGKGVEGWNCPSLFACALIKEQAGNNYVLQASTRCLRQVAGNLHPAKVFLDRVNAKILDKELLANFRTDLGRLAMERRGRETVTLRILKTELPELSITRTVGKVVKRSGGDGNLTFKKPPAKQEPPGVLRTVLSPDFSGSLGILRSTGEVEELPAGKSVTGCYSAAWRIAARHHLPFMPVLTQLKALYPGGEMPDDDLYGLLQQVEEQQQDYETIEEAVTERKALIRVRDENGEAVFEEENGRYVHRQKLLRATFEQMREQGLFARADDGEHKTADGYARFQDQHELSFHYEPYNFDSTTERDLFRQVLEKLNLDPCEVRAFLFTGGLTDPKKTDFHFEYLGKDQRYHRYFPDFVLVKSTGEFYIIEVKGEHLQGDATVEAKRKAMERLQSMQPDKFEYQVVPTAAGMAQDADAVGKWVNSQR